MNALGSFVVSTSLLFTNVMHGWTMHLLLIRGNDLTLELSLKIIKSFLLLAVCYTACAGWNWSATSPLVPPDISLVGAVRLSCREFSFTLPVCARDTDLQWRMGRCLEEQRVTNNSSGDSYWSAGCQPCQTNGSYLQLTAKPKIGRPCPQKTSSNAPAHSDGYQSTRDFCNFAPSQIRKMELR